ncbi:MAG: LysR family transcriptional regulator [Gemmatimonadetes bacterium]|nr:LysR family transcriptional regulator [Gemmatimonadota bacterium]
MSLTISQLEVVRAIYQTESVTAAAELLKLTQPAVSYRLKQAETKLGGLLFDRQSGRMRATPAGSRVVHAARSVAEELELLVRDVSEILAGRDGALRLSTVCSTAYHWLPPVLDRFRKAYPGVEVEVDSSSNRVPIEAVERGELDVALTTDPPNRKGLIATHLFDDEIVAVVAPDDPLVHRRHLNANDFADLTVLVFDRHRSDLFKYVLNPRGVRPKRVLDVEATEALVAMVRSGMGVGVLASWVVQPHLDTGELVGIRVTRSGIKRKWTAVTSTGPGTPPYVRAFVAELKRQFRVSAPLSKSA